MMTYSNLKPFIKWTGCKTALSKHIVPHTRGGRLVVPFLGAGGLTAKYVQHHGASRGLLLADYEPDLINAYEVVRDQTDELIERLDELVGRHSETAYYSERNRYNLLRHNRRQSPMTPLSEEQRLRIASLFIYMQNAGFNGLRRINSDGDLNVPIGRDSKGNLHGRKRICPEAAIRAWANLLNSNQVLLACQGFDTTIRAAQPYDEIYCDPPYTGGHVRYAGAWDESCDRGLEAHLTLAVTNTRKVRALVSQPDTKLAREIWKRHERFDLSRSGRVSRKADGRGRVPELLYRVRARRGTSRAVIDE